MKKFLLPILYCAVISASLLAAGAAFASNHTVNFPSTSQGQPFGPMANGYNCLELDPSNVAYGGGGTCVQGSSLFASDEYCYVAPYVCQSPPNTCNATTNCASLSNTFRSLCPNGWYMAGIKKRQIGSSNERDYFQVQCAPGPAAFSSDFPSTSGFVATGPMTRFGATYCPNGSYVAGIRGRQNGGWDETQILCAPAPAAIAGSFPSTSGPFTMVPAAGWLETGLALCPNGYYVAGYGRAANDNEYDAGRIFCAQAPTLNFGGTGQQCWPGNTCNPGNICQAGVCVAAGDINQPCLPGNTCNPGLSCISGICRSTGGAGEQCNPGNTCDSGSLVCCTAQNLCISQNPTFTISANPITSGGALTVDASASAISGATFSWNWGDGTPGSTDITASHLYRNIGNAPLTRTITLTATQCNLQGITTQTVTVLPAAPTASFTVNPSSGPVPLVVQVDGRGSTDPDAAVGGGITRFVWNWGEAGVADEIGGPTSSHTYRAIGQYTITLTVYDAGQLSSTAQQTVTVTDRYICAPACSGTTPVCGPSETAAGATQCYQCRSDAQCGTGYQCLGSDCRQGERCPDGTACPLDGRCAEAVACAAGSLCADGSACPASGICAPDKNICSLAADSVLAQCYVETRAPQTGSCTSDDQCTDGLKGGRCTGTATAPGTCEYARCLYERTSQTCTTDSECTNGDGVCSNGSCNYIYDCAYGPGLGSGVAGLYTQTPATQMPAMPLGIQPDGEACTKPSPGAPNNCEGVNGCLYYNYEVTRGSTCSSSAQCGSGQSCVADACVPGGICPGGATCPASGVCAQSYCYSGGPVAGTANNPVGNSVANCTNEVEGGTGCVYYGDQASLNKKVNCLPRLANGTERQSRESYAGIPAGCVVVDVGNDLKDYNCTAVDFCYYYANGRVDCDYALDPDDPLQRGTGCIYEPNPEGPFQCPREFKAPTAGTSFVQCLLNPDALLPGFVLGGGNGGMSACRVNADCPPGNVCLEGTCFPECQAGVDCTTGTQCVQTCTTSADCNGNLVCNGGACVPPPACVPGTICLNGALCPQNGVCPSTPPSCTPGSICLNGALCPQNGVCPSQPPSCIPGTICLNGQLCPQNGVCPVVPPGSCIPGTICPNAAVCPQNGVCPSTPPSCIPGTICPNNAICPANGICPSTPPTCTPGTLCPDNSICPQDGVCPITQCPGGTSYDAATGQCISCSIDPTLPGCGTFIDFCTLNPTSPICGGGGGNPPPGGTGVLQCNTLGYTFTGTAVTPAGNCDLVAVILAILSWIAWLIALLAVLSGLRAAFLYITAMGDDKRLREARAYLVYTTIGVGVAVLTFGIVAITRALLNI